MTFDVLILHMDLNELWIGDQVKIISLQQQATFEGINDEGKAKLKVATEYTFVDADDVELMTEEELAKTAPSEIEETPQQKKLPTEKFEPTIDLHIEALHPDHKSLAPEMILPYQIKKCKEHVEKAIRLFAPSMVIIHGKGTGLLRQEVAHLLRNYKEVLHAVPLSDGGAWEVYMQYR